jgi:hypothetical protein
MKIEPSASVYRVLTVNSEILATLNQNAFHDDVSYAAAIGTDIRYGVAFGTRLDTFRAFKPLANVDWNPNDRDLFPWIKTLNPGEDDSDGMVPDWSAQLGVHEFNWYVETNHTGLPTILAYFRQ